jgi:predicted small metal-binding protein
MAKTVQCDCGFVARSESDDDLIRQVQQHAKSVHDMDLTAEQVLDMAHPE